ncbi:MAG: hypothetical protein U0X93_09025 [Anaerolineales bacterium]
MEVAIRNQLKTLQHGIARTKERIAEFEKRANLSSKEFEKSWGKESWKRPLKR